MADPSLVQPEVRAEIEREVALIAAGVNDKATVVSRSQTGQIWLWGDGWRRGFPVYIFV